VSENKENKEIKEKPAKAKAPQKDAKDAKKKAEAPKQEAKPRVKFSSEWEKRYKDECLPALMKQFNYGNKMQAPKLTKIVVNTSMKEALQDVKLLQNASDEIAAITGQRPVITKAKKSIANFKLRQGQSIGASVTLRGKVMYEFMNRLVNVALPRVRDFKGVSFKSFDGRGNYTLGLTEQTIFPEINFDKVQKQYGMNLTFVTTARTDEEGRALLTLLGMPFRTA
jgi:large subunit ribosomal protein L5